MCQGSVAPALHGFYCSLILQLAGVTTTSQGPIMHHLFEKPFSQRSRQVLASFANQGKWKYVMRCFSDMRRCHLQDHVAHGTALESYAQCGQWQRVFHAVSGQALRKCISDVTVGCAVVDACQHGRRWLASAGSLDVLGHLASREVQLFQEKARATCACSMQGSCFHV